MIEKIIGYNFKDDSLLHEALTHPSLCNSHDHLSYERLEFLGDSALNLVVAEILIKKFPGEDEGKLAKRRAALVSGETLTKIALEIHLENSILMSEAEERSGGRENPHNLENVFEALLGAIYLDAGIEKLKEIITKFWQNHIDSMKEVPIDPKSKLQEVLQKSGLELPKYELIESHGPKHMLTFKVGLKIDGFNQVFGEGKSKQQAEKNAANLLLIEMGEA